MYENADKQRISLLVRKDGKILYFEGMKAQLETLQNAAAEGAIRSKELDGMRLTSQQLERELMSLKDERQQVLSKVDGLLSSLDGLALD